MADHPQTRHIIAILVRWNRFDPIRDANPSRYWYLSPHFCCKEGIFFVKSRSLFFCSFNNKTGSYHILAAIRFHRPRCNFTDEFRRIRIGSLSLICPMFSVDGQALNATAEADASLLKTTGWIIDTVNNVHETVHRHDWFFERDLNEELSMLANGFTGRVTDCDISE